MSAVGWWSVSAAAVWRGLCCVCAPALALAWLEIEIEGADGGWARDLPTWRHTPRFLRWLVHEDRPFTGYHVTLGLTMFATSHCPLYLAAAAAAGHGAGHGCWGWRWQEEFALVSCLLLMMGLEDHLWFCFNHGYRSAESRGQHSAHFDSVWDRYGTYVALCALSAAFESLSWWWSSGSSGSAAASTWWWHLATVWSVVLGTAVAFALACELVLMPLHRSARQTLLRWTAERAAVERQEDKHQSRRHQSRLVPPLL